MLQAKEACRAVNKALLSSCVLDRYGNEGEGRPKGNVKFPLDTVKCFEADSARTRKSMEIQHHLWHNFSRMGAIEIADLFMGHNVVFICGIPGSGKTTLCHSILRDWLDGKLWQDHYDFAFYVHTILLVGMHSEKWNEEVVLKALYTEVFELLTVEELELFKCLIIIDSVDECDMLTRCAHEAPSPLGNVITQLIIRRENCDKIIVGRPHACGDVRQKLLHDVPFQDLQVIGFSTEQLKSYVDKFFQRAVTNGAERWRHIRENGTLFAMMHLPVFAGIMCDIFARESAIVIETLTEIYVCAYAVFVARHVRGRSPENLSCGSFQSLFEDDGLLDGLAKVSRMAFENQTSGKVFFKSHECCLTDSELPLIFSFMIQRHALLFFSHSTLIDFFLAVHLFINRVKLDDKLIRNDQWRGVLPLYFGLLGGAVENSDSPRIICDFVRPLIRKFRIDSVVKHALVGEVGGLVYDIGDYQGAYLNLVFEFKNARLLKDRDLFWKNDGWLVIFHHQEFDGLFFFLTNFISWEERRIRWLIIQPFDDEISLHELQKLRSCLSTSGGKMDELGLCNFSVNGDKMKLLAACCCFVREVSLHIIQATGGASWSLFAQHIREAKHKNSLRIEKLWMNGCEVDQAVQDEIKELVQKVIIH